MALLVNGAYEYRRCDVRRKEMLIDLGKEHVLFSRCDVWRKEISIFLKKENNKQTSETLP